ncbi:MAG: hypothetical protein NTY22_06990 [Proteobacteria bacterium]|nr:hypothetical protein [Pseudomonadota bacterium]
MFWHILITISLSFNIYAADPKDIAKYKSYTAYKQAISEYNKQNYEKAMEYTENSLTLYASNKKSKELLTKLKEKGEEYYTTGVSLEHFNKELAIEYLKKAQTLLRSSDKKIKKKVIDALNNLQTERTETDDE